MLRTRISGFFLVLGLAGAVISCEKRPEQASDYPLPGELRVVSVDKLADDTPAENLISNGNFDEWYAGAPAPTGFVPPKDDKISFIRRRDPRGGAGRHSTDQFWESSDADVAPLERFHAVVRGLKPETVYRLDIHAVSFGNTGASLSVWELQDSGELGGCWPNLIAIEPGESLYSRYSKTFVTNQTSAVMIGSHTNPQTKYRARVLWLEWRLTEAPTDEAGKPERTKLPTKFVMTQPSNVAETVQLSAGETLVCKGWFVADQDETITYVLGDQEKEATYNTRPDLEGKYPGYRRRSGWTVEIPAEALQEENRVTFRLGGNDQTAITVKVSPPAPESPESPAGTKPEKDAGSSP